MGSCTRIQVPGPMSQQQSPGMFVGIPRLTEILKGSTHAFNSYFFKHVAGTVLGPRIQR